MLGIVLSIIGVIMFLQNVVVSSFTLFYHFGRVNVGGILIILTVVAFIEDIYGIDIQREVSKGCGSLFNGN